MVGCLRLGGRHLEEDASDVRDGDRVGAGGDGGDDRPASLASGTERKNPENG